MSKQILVVDDSQSFANALTGMLEDEGHSITTCYDQATALEALQTQHFDLVITDRQMHLDDRAGFKVAEAARANGDMPIIMVTGGITPTNEPILRGDIKKIGGETYLLDRVQQGLANTIRAIANGDEGKNIAQIGM